MKVGDNVFVCTGAKDGVECGFALCNECKQRCSTGRGSRRSRGVVSTASNSLTDEEMKRRIFLLDATAIIPDCNKEAAVTLAAG